MRKLCSYQNNCPYHGPVVYILRKKEQKRNCYMQVMLLIMNIAYLRYDTDTINFFSIESPNRQLHNWRQTFSCAWLAWLPLIVSNQVNKLLFPSWQTNHFYLEFNGCVTRDSWLSSRWWTSLGSECHVVLWNVGWKYCIRLQNCMNDNDTRMNTCVYLQEQW